MDIFDRVVYLQGDRFHKHVYQRMTFYYFSSYFLHSNKKPTALGRKFMGIIIVSDLTMTRGETSLRQCQKFKLRFLLENNSRFSCTHSPFL